MMKIAFCRGGSGADDCPARHSGQGPRASRLAQVDMQTGLHIDDPANYSRGRRRYDSNAAVGVGPGGVTIGPRQRCRMETNTIKRDDGRRITRRERVCN